LNAHFLGGLLNARRFAGGGKMVDGDVKLSRRAALKGATALAVAGAAFAVSDAPAESAPAIVGDTKLTVTGYFRGPAFLVAAHKGLFAKERLDVEFHLARLAPEHNRGMAEGRWPITLSSADTMLARATQDGVDFVAFMQADEGLSVQLVVQPAIKSFADLRGKLFAADPVDSNYDLIRNKIMRDHGIAESEYRIEVLGSSSVRAAAFEAGKVDAAMLQQPFSERAIAKGGVVLAEASDYVHSWPLTCGWGLRGWCEANRQTVVRFVRAMAAASDWLLAPDNREETIRLIMQEEKLSRARAENSYRMVVPKCMVRPETIRRNLELRIELGYYKPPHKGVEAFYDASFWSEATGLPAPPPAGRPRNAVPA
jgi:ABC-type nitrate/sulfonate/bicarbonate transport system substrate-binding protein